MNECSRCGADLEPGESACAVCGHLTAPAACDRHPDQSAAGQCALCGRALCRECDQGRKPYHLCAEHAGVPVIEGWAQVVEIPDELEARLIEDNLRAEGIEARLLDQKDHSAFPVEFGDLARVRVLVPTAEYAEAERILAAHRNSAGEVSFGCPNCGEAYEEGDTVCGSCGEALV